MALTLDDFAGAAPRLRLGFLVKELTTELVDAGNASADRQAQFRRYVYDAMERKLTGAEWLKFKVLAAREELGDFLDSEATRFAIALGFGGGIQKLATKIGSAGARAAFSRVLVRQGAPTVRKALEIGSDVLSRRMRGYYGRAPRLGYMAVSDEAFFANIGAGVAVDVMFQGIDLVIDEAVKFLRKNSQERMIFEHYGERMLEPEVVESVASVMLWGRPYGPDTLKNVPIRAMDVDRIFAAITLAPPPAAINDEVIVKPNMGANAYEEWQGETRIYNYIVDINKQAGDPLRFDK